MSLRIRASVFALAFVFAFLAGCDSLGTLRTRLAERDVREKVGVLANLDIAWPDSTKALLRALGHFRAERVGRVVILGDPTKDGFANQRKVFEEAWRKAFAGGAAPELVMAEDPYAYGGIRFTGRGRFPLTDLLCVHPSDGRLVNAGSMHGIKVSDVFVRQDGATAGRIAASAQGLLVVSRDDGLEIRRLDFSGPEAEEVGSPWRVDREGMIHSDADAIPKFWPDTIVDVTLGYARNGRRMYTVRWPPVLAKHTGARAFSYDVSIGKEVVRRVQSEGFFLPESRDAAAVKCHLWADEFGEQVPRFGITPISSMGKRGPTVWSR